MNEEKEKRYNSLLTFRLEDESFGVSVDKVLEILEVGRITKVPNAPDYMLGVVNLRGNVLPVIDTRVKFGLPSRDFTVDTCIIVLGLTIENNESISVGALVDAVQEVVKINETDISPLPRISSKYRSEFISGMVNLEESFIMMLDVDQIFTSEELNMVLESSPDQQASETV